MLNERHFESAHAIRSTTLSSSVYMPASCGFRYRVKSQSAEKRIHNGPIQTLCDYDRQKRQQMCLGTRFAMLCQTCPHCQLLRDAACLPA